MVRRTNRKNNKKYSKKIKKYSKNNCSKRRRNYSSFKNKKNKKYQKGGNFNLFFLNNYDSNLEKIQFAIERYSGIHGMDEEMKNRFINEQLTTTRRNAARDLIENTIYITLQEVASIIEQLIIKTYTQHNLEQYENIYLFTSTPNKSFYFISVLALFYIRQHGFKEPTKFISKLDTDVFQEVGSNPILLIDDVSYSGSQMSDMLNKIYETEVLRKRKIPPNIIISLIGLNYVSKRKIETVYSKIGNLNPIPSPFKLVYLEERLYKPLVLKLGIERYFIINLFFSQMLSGYPLVSIYLDHKIADEISTYKKTLLYGPIVPKKYDYLSKLIHNIDDNNIKNYFELYIKFQDYSVSFFEQDFIELLNQFNSENPENRIIYNGNKQNIKNIMYQILCYVLNKVNIKEQQELQSDEILESQIKFRPFINTCKNDKKLLENIDDIEIQNMDYSFFNLPSDCILGKTCSFADFNNLMIGLNMYSKYENEIKGMEIPSKPNRDDKRQLEMYRNGNRLNRKDENGNFLISDDEIYERILTSYDREMEEYNESIMENINNIKKDIPNYEEVLVERNNINNNLTKLELVDCPFTWYKKYKLKMT
jgi:hypothetical protein